MKLSTKTKQNIGAFLLTVAAVAVGVGAYNYVVSPAIAWGKGKLSKPVTTTPPAGG
jgi:hypothetical protein